MQKNHLPAKLVYLFNVKSNTALFLHIVVCWEDILNGNFHFEVELLPQSKPVTFFRCQTLHYIFQQVKATASHTPQNSLYLLGP